MPTAKRKPRPAHPKAQHAFDFLCAYIQANGFPPSLTEIASEIGTGGTGPTTTVLSDLERCGLISRTPGVARGLRVLKQPGRSVKAK